MAWRIGIQTLGQKEEVESRDTEMLIFNGITKKKEERVLLAFSVHEAREVIRKLEELIQFPRFHHDHLEDVTNNSLLDLTVVDLVPLETYEKTLRDAIQQTVWPKRNEGQPG